jgi:hypothetical protein
MMPFHTAAGLDDFSCHRPGSWRHAVLLSLVVASASFTNADAPGLTLSINDFVADFVGEHIVERHILWFV